MVENDAVNVTAYVRTYKDPTGVLWHNFNGYRLADNILLNDIANFSVAMIPKKRLTWLV